MLRDVLDKEIQKNLSKDEKNFYGLDEAIRKEQEKIASDFSRKAVNVVEATLSGADRISLDEIELRLTRLKNLRKYLRAANVGETEEQLVESIITKAEVALTKQKKWKKSIFNKANSAVSQSSIDMGALLIGMSGGDPLLGLGVKLVGDMLRGRKERKAEADRENKETLRQDAEGLKDASTQALPQNNIPFDNSREEPLVRDRTPTISSDSDPRIVGLLQDIFLYTEEISDDVKLLVKAAEMQVGQLKRAALDDAEAAREKIKAGGLVRDGKTPGAKIADRLGFGKIADAIDFAKDIALLGLSLPAGIGALAARFGAVAGLAASAVWFAIDGILGYFKADEWGTSGFAAAFGGFFGGTLDDTVWNTIGNMGKFAVAGAALGSVFPVVGTLLGGVIGAAIGGLLGWIGGENIAQFADDVGGFVKEAAGKIFTFIWDGIMGIFTWAKDLVTGILSYLPGYDDIVRTIDAMWQKLKATSQKVAEMSGEAYEGVGDMAGDAIDSVTGFVGYGPVTSRGQEQEAKTAYAQEQLIKAQDRRANRNRARALDKTDGRNRLEKVRGVQSQQRETELKRARQQTKREVAKARTSDRQLKRSKDFVPKGTLSPEALEKVYKISARLNIKPEWLIAAMSFETGGTFSPSIKNPNSSATGLIQFMDATARGLNTSTSKLAKMSQVEQLDYVEKYFQPFKGKMNSLADVYSAILSGQINEGGDDANIFSGKNQTAAYLANIGLDADKNGMITKAEAASKPQQHLAAAQKLVATAEMKDTAQMVEGAQKQTAMAALAGSKPVAPAATIIQTNNQTNVGGGNSVQDQNVDSRRRSASGVVIG